MDKNQSEIRKHQNYQFVNGIILLKILSKIHKNIVKLLGFFKENEKLTIVTKVSTENKQLIFRVSREYDILSSLDHFNIVKVFKDKYTFKTNKNVYYIEEYLNLCNLHRFIQEFKNRFKRSPTEIIIQHIIKQLIEGVTYLHSNRIIHRNLNTKTVMLHIQNSEKFCEKHQIPSSLINELIFYNLIDDLHRLYLNKLFQIKDISLFEKTFTEYIQIKIIDLGIAKELNTDISTNTVFLIDKGAPETQKDNYSFPSDFWSIGIITFELLTGTEYNVLNDNVDEKQLPETLICSNKIINFINLMLERNPNKRRENFSVIKNNPFITMNFEEEQQINIDKKESGSKSFFSGNSFLKYYFDYVDEERGIDNVSNIQSNSFSCENNLGEYLFINASYLDSLYSEQVTKVVEYQENEYSLSDFF